MQIIVDFFTAIGDIITFVIDFVISLFEDIVFVVQLCAQLLINIGSYFSWLPAEAISMVVVMITVIIIFRIAGRE